MVYIGSVKPVLVALIVCQVLTNTASYGFAALQEEAVFSRTPIIIAAAPEPVSLVINGKRANSSPGPLIRNDRTFVPIRLVSETLGCQVSYDSLKRTISIARDRTRVLFTPGNRTATLYQGNMKRLIHMDAEPFIAEDRAFVPVRFVAQALSELVAWDAPTRTAYIVSREFYGKTGDPASPELVMPVQSAGFTAFMPTLSWNAVASPSGATIRYQTEIQGPSEKRQSEWIDETGWIPPIAAEPGSYTWRVRAFDLGTGKLGAWSESRVFSIKKFTPTAAAPALRQPLDGARLENAWPVFSWSPVSGSSGIPLEYRVEIVEGPVTVDSGWISGTTWLPRNLAVKAGRYRWRVRSFDSVTSLESRSTTREFSVARDAAPPPAPVPGAPRNGSSAIAPLRFMWSSVKASGAGVKYFAEVFNCPSPASSGWIESTEWTLRAALPGTYHWRVKAQDLNSGLTSEWSDPVAFSIDRLPDPPGRPGLLAPEDDFIAVSHPELRWSAVESTSGAAVQYWVEITGPKKEASGWINATNWKPAASTVKPGMYSWRVKAIDRGTGRESGFGESRQYRVMESSPGEPPILGPAAGSTHVMAPPLLSWSAVRTLSGAPVRYWVEVYEGPVRVESGWLDATSWRPSRLESNPGQYEWRVKCRDMETGKESGFSKSHFRIVAGDSSDLSLQVIRAQYGCERHMLDVIAKVQAYATDERLSVNASNDLVGHDPCPGETKQLAIVYRNRWNEEWRIAVPQGTRLVITRDSRVGQFIFDGDDRY